MATPRLLADEMVGSLARYLRMMGCDTTYAQGWSDEEIVRNARAEDRIVVTRDRDLSRRAGRALLLTSPRLEDQVREVWRAIPGVATEIRFERCTLCNGPLALEDYHAVTSEQEGIPWDRVAAGMPLYRCGHCGHAYWEGSHTAEVRRRLREWTLGRTP